MQGPQMWHFRGEGVSHPMICWNWADLIATAWKHWTWCGPDSSSSSGLVHALTASSTFCLGHHAQLHHFIKLWCWGGVWIAAEINRISQNNTVDRNGFFLHIYRKIYLIPVTPKHKHFIVWNTWSNQLQMYLVCVNTSKKNKRVHCVWKHLL